MTKASDLIAAFLEEKNIRYVFGIIGAGNAHIFDSIYQRGFTEIVCVHHEQAACMAMQTYYRQSGIITAAILTTGGGSTNATTGVASAWADSIPGIVISGNENSKYMTTPGFSDLRMWGVQGYDSSFMSEAITKYASRVLDAEKVIYELEKAYHIAGTGRPGPVWVDVPMNVQSTNVDESKLEKFIAAKAELAPTTSAQASEVVKLLEKAKRPVFWFGNGIRLSGAEKMISKLLQKFQVPSLVSWAGIDMIDSDHPLVYGRAGTYGQRAANFVVQNSDLVICIGTRMAIPQVGYDINEFAREAKVVAVDIDEKELGKYKSRLAVSVCEDAKIFITQLLSVPSPGLSYDEWKKQCDKYRTSHPWVTASDHPDKDGFINSYRFIDKLNDHLKPDQSIVTDMGTALLSGHQALKLKGEQRLMTSTGLGEMGYGLPAALGASFARDRGEVLCLNCDGGMMMNLQELQTIVHHKLPIKIFIFNNDGYLMIKHTQKSLFKGRYSGTDKASGVSCPDFSAIAKAFNIPAFQIRTWEDFDRVIPEVQALATPVICEVFMHPEQLFVPKLSLAIKHDGSLISPPLEDLSPFLDRKQLAEEMIIGVHEKSKAIEI
jgi:acetolactate synthase I/II/III large subunit